MIVQVPDVLKRLHDLKDKCLETSEATDKTPETFKRPFAAIHQQDGLNLEQPAEEDKPSPVKGMNTSPVNSQENGSKLKETGLINGVLVTSEGDSNTADNEVESEDGRQRTLSAENDSNTAEDSSPISKKRRKLQSELDALMSPTRETPSEY